MDFFEHTAKALEMIKQTIEQTLVKSYQPSPRMARAIALQKAICALNPGTISPAAQMVLLIHDALEQEAELAKTQAIVMDTEHP